MHNFLPKKSAGNENLQINTYCETFVVLKAVTLKVPVLWAFMPRGLA
jgi:hypothetical protein